MTPASQIRNRIRFHADLIALSWLGLGILPQLSAGAAPAEPPRTSPLAIVTVDLNYQETDEVLAFSAVGVRLQTTAFRKEPPLGAKDAVRGFISGGPQPDIPFIWDKSRGRLYLDLNRNQDLSDDPEGVFVSASPATPVANSAQSFTNVHLPIASGAAAHPAKLQLDFRYFQSGPLQVHAGLCSYWQARLIQGGGDWQFGILEHLVGTAPAAPPRLLLLRPWVERQRSVAPGAPDLFTFTNHIFFDGRAYDLSCRYDASPPAARYRVIFQEQTAPLGELTISGTGLHRLVLTSNRGLTAILDHPQGTLKLPVGIYSLDEIWLRDGKFEAACFGGGTLTINEHRPAHLVAGGPLTNTVQLSSDREHLRLEYRLRSADRNFYQLPRKNPPTFTIFHGTNRLASDKFTFG